jgi:glycosyltransferase involved in cell wall biosynthesis
MIMDRLSQYEKPVYYLPWPTHIPNDFSRPRQREKQRGVYVGSLYPFKNTQEFGWSLPRILEETPTKEFVVVGPGPHAEIIKELQKKTRGAVKYIRELPRTQALQLIAASHYAYTPVAKGGWGFINDCWSVKTPIVMTHNDNYVTNRVNALVAEKENALTEKINLLYYDTNLFKRLQINGHKEIETRNAKVIGSRLQTIFAETIKRANHV